MKGRHLRGARRGGLELHILMSMVFRLVSFSQWSVPSAAGVICPEGGGLSHPSLCWQAPNPILFFVNLMLFFKVLGYRFNLPWLHRKQLLHLIVVNSSPLALRLFSLFFFFSANRASYGFFLHIFTNWSEIAQSPAYFGQ